MSSTNVELVRSIYTGWQRGDFGAHSELYDPEIRYERVMDATMDGVGLAGAWEGLDGLAKGARLWIDAWAGLSVTAEEFREVGDKVVVLTRQTGRARASGVPLDRQMADVFEIRNGRVTAISSYWKRRDALAAVGLQQ